MEEHVLNSEKKILLVDDDPGILEVLQDILGLEFLITEKALNAELAFQKILEDSYALIVCDMEIPRFSGVELVQRLRSSGNLVPVIFLSSNLNDRKKDQANAVGARAILAKPFDIENLIRVVRESLV